MRSVKSIQRDLLRVAPRAAAALFIIPSLVWIFTSEVLRQQDAAFHAATQGEQAEGMEATDSRLNVIEAFASTPPSSVCVITGEPALDTFRAAYCQPWSRQWQLTWALWAAKFVIGAGVLLLAASAALALAASRSRAARVRVITAGQRFLRGASMGAVLVQGAMLVWLAYWVPDTLFGAGGAIVAVLTGLAACAAAAGAAWMIFQRAPDAPSLLGESIIRDDAPALWERVASLAQKLGATPPRHIVATIDSQFCISAGDLGVKGYKVRGPVLAMSLPLLRTLEGDEVEALLARGLSINHGAQAAATPALEAFDRYLATGTRLRFGAVARLLLVQYRLLLELALGKSMRDAELVADLVAMRQTSPAATAHAMIKLAGYAAYRAHVTRKLGARGSTFDASVSLSERVADGLRPFVRSPKFAAAMTSPALPQHDGLPALAERIRSLGTVVTEAEYATIMLMRGPNTWLSAIPGAEHIERRLWLQLEAELGLPPQSAAVAPTSHS